MRIAVLGFTLVASLVFAAIVAVLLPGVSFAQRAQAVANQPGGGLITMATTVGDHVQWTVIDPETRTMAVYHVDASKGEIELKSVRNIHYDLKMNVFNGTNPLPSDIRALLGQK